ncbi:MAG: helix-turn-helix transcriptional regulator [Candidatus Binataceae bacterium]
MSNAVERVLVRPAEAAQMIGVSRSKVYELIGSGALRAVRLDGGRLLRVPVAEIHKLADQGRPEGAAR